MEIRDRTHPEHPTGWDVTVAHRGEIAGDTFRAAASGSARQHRGLRARVAGRRCLSGRASRRLPPTCAHSRPSRAPRHQGRSSACSVIPASAERVSGNPAKNLHRYALQLDTRSALRLAGIRGSARPYQEFTQGRAQALLRCPLAAELRGVKAMPDLGLLWSPLCDRARGAARRVQCPGKTNDRDQASVGTKPAPRPIRFGAIEVAGRQVLGRAGAALARQFQDRLGEAAQVDHTRARHRQARGRRGEHGPRPARPASSARPSSPPRRR